LELIEWRCDICNPSVEKHSSAKVTILKPGVVIYKLPEITSTYTEKYIRYTNPSLDLPFYKKVKTVT